MRIIAYSSLRMFSERHPVARPAIDRWHRAIKTIAPTSMAEIQAAFPRAKVLNGDRVRFEIAGGQFRLVVAIDFERQIVFVKFLGTHAQYDAINALTVSQF
jgi:mRNA interferase HigB